MRPSARRTSIVAALAALLLVVSCEKETHRAARSEFQALMAHPLPPAEQAQALEGFVQRFPEPKTNPYLIRAFTLLAEYHAGAGRPDIAASWYERAIRATPADPDLLNALGYLYAGNGMNLDRAVAVLEAAVRLAEERGYAPRRQGFIKDSLGWAYRKRGDLALSVALLEEANRLAPDVPILREHLADAYGAIGERDKALAILLDLYMQGRATDHGLRRSLEDLGREGGPAMVRDITRRLEQGLATLAEDDRREAEQEGASLVQVTAADGTRLAGSLFVPAPSEARRPSPWTGRRGAVLLLHALGSNRHAAAPLARALAERGLVALAIDLRGHGGSVSEALPGPHQFVEQLNENLAAGQQDIRAGLAYLVRVPRVDRLRLGLVGAGLGALLAARAIDPAADPRPVAIAILSPWGRSEPYQARLSLLDRGAALLVAGRDEPSAAGTVETLARTLGQGGPKPILIDGTGSGYELLGRSEDRADSGDLADRIAAFLAERLR